MAAGLSSFVVDADLHGLVDGHIEPERRAETLRRIAASPADRARVEAWQAQTDLLRSAFAGVEREPLPIMLDLKAKPRLQCIPANDSPLVGTIGGFRDRAPKRRRLAFTLATAMVVTAGLGAGWYALDTAQQDAPLASATLRGTVDATLAARSTEAVTRTGASAPAAAGLDRLPTSEIPDLRTTGFHFIGADVDGAAPQSVQFRYQNSAADRLVISVARATADSDVDTPPLRVGNAYLWHKRDAAFAIAGTVRPARLKAIAAALQDGDL